jgi:hypothetical protein
MARAKKKPAGLVAAVRLARAERGEKTARERAARVFMDALWPFVRRCALAYSGYRFSRDDLADLVQDAARAIHRALVDADRLTDGSVIEGMEDARVAAYCRATVTNLLRNYDRSAENAAYRRLILDVRRAVRALRVPTGGGKPAADPEALARAALSDGPVGSLAEEAASGRGTWNAAAVAKLVARVAEISGGACVPFEVMLEVAGHVTGINPWLRAGSPEAGPGDVETEPASRLRDTDLSPEERATLGDAAARTVRLLGAVGDPRLLPVLRMRYVRGLTLEETFRATGVPVSTLHHLCERKVLPVLRNELAGCMSGDRQQGLQYYLRRIDALTREEDEG